MYYFELDLKQNRLYLSSEIMEKFHVDSCAIDGVLKKARPEIIHESSAEAYEILRAEICGPVNSVSSLLRILSRSGKRYIRSFISWARLGGPDGEYNRVIGSLETDTGHLKMQLKGSDYNELKELRKLVKAQTGYLEKSEAYLKELRRYRHDQKNNLIAVSGLLESGDIEGAKKYVGSFVEILNRKTPIINTGNPSIDMVVTSKIAEAQEFNIKVQHIIGLPKDVQINRKDLCLAVGSCFDNAIEACIKARQKHRHPVISLLLIEKHGVIIFKMTNTSVTPVPETFSGISTTKQDTQNHGFGLKNVREIVARHNGYIEVIPEERQFTINFTLQGD